MSHCLITLIECTPLTSSGLLNSEVTYGFLDAPPRTAYFPTIALLESGLIKLPERIIALPLSKQVGEARELLETFALPSEALIWDEQVASGVAEDDQLERLLSMIAEYISGFDLLTLDASLLTQGTLIEVGNYLNKCTRTQHIKSLEVWSAALTRRGMYNDLKRAEFNVVWRQPMRSSTAQIASEQVTLDQVSAPDSTQPHRAQPLIDTSEEARLINRRYQQLFKQYKKLALSMHKIDSKDKAKRIRRALLTDFPDRKEEILALSDQINQATQLLQQAYKQGADSKILLSKAQINRAKKLGFNGLLEQAKRDNEAGIAAFNRKAESTKRRQSGTSLSTVKPVTVTYQPKSFKLSLQPVQRATFPVDQTELHQNDIRAQEPWTHWTMLIDETGNNFKAGTSGRNTGFVSILIPEGRVKLPKLPKKWHATEINKLQEIDQVVQTVLNNKIGVLGVSLESLPVTREDRWLDGIISIVELALRLLPLDGPTFIHVKIENRAQYHSDYDLSDLEHLIMNRLGRAWPERSKLIQLKLTIITKDGDNRIAYSDAIAFSWGSPRPESKVRIQRSQLIGPCLINDSAEELVSLWDHFDGAFKLRPLRWIELATRGDAQHTSASLTSTLLRRHAENLRNQPTEWGRLVEVCLDEEFKKVHSIDRLGQLVKWLEMSRPSDLILPKPMALVWETVKLSERNHKGDFSTEGRESRLELSHSLFDEDARLVCEADLYEAVSLTNQFMFTEARALLTPWLQHGRALTGLRLWGRLHSSLGQHAAFLGDNSKAYEHFKIALESFDLLSHDQKRDLDQTGTYSMIAMMDDHSKSDHEVFMMMSSYLDRTPEKRILELAASGIEEQYKQHTLLRWLVVRGHEASSKQYLSMREKWQEDEGHPWPLMKAYRAILLARKAGKVTEEARTMLKSATQDTSEGVTMRFISAVLSVLSAQWGTPWVDAQEQLSELKAQLPRLSDELMRIENTLKQDVGEPILSPNELRAWFNSMLPFNFH